MILSDRLEHAVDDIQITPQYVEDVLSALIQIDSTNPSCTPGGKGEAEMAAYLGEELRHLGLEVRLHEMKPGRVNIVGRLPGKGNGRSLMFNGHTDTVGVEGMEDPFSAKVEDGKMYGRGAIDMKGSLAAMLGAVKALVDGGVNLGGDLIFAGVADEEQDSIGTFDILHYYKTDGAIVTEPTNLELCRAHRGYIHYEVKTHGKAAHGSRYWEGIDANMRMGRFLARLENLERELRQRTARPLMGVPSLHAAILQGGRELSTYAEECSLKIERRTVTGESPERVTLEFQAIIDELSAADPSFKASLSWFTKRSPFEIDPGALIVQSLERAYTSHLGKAPNHIGQTFWTDAALLNEAGIETVIIGPTGDGLHAAVEWVDIQSVITLAGVLAETAHIYCNQPA